MLDIEVRESESCGLDGCIHREFNVLVSTYGVGGCRCDVVVRRFHAFRAECWRMAVDVLQYSR